MNWGSTLPVAASVINTGLAAPNGTSGVQGLRSNF